ncbi:hypothetical protein F4824DRAFT_477393 [Ustulina deusta]|nr:hypothetical protein F4824DRAFT_477393 [Ustulina deusta]
MLFMVSQPSSAAVVRSCFTIVLLTAWACISHLHERDIATVKGFEPRSNERAEPTTEATVGSPSNLHYTSVSAPLQYGRAERNLGSALASSRLLVDSPCHRRQQFPSDSLYW